MTPKRLAFIREFVGPGPNAGNAAASYRAAGFRAANNHVAAVEGSRLLATPDITEAIAAAHAEIARRAEVSASRVLAEYLSLAFNDLRDVFVTGPDGALYMRPVRDWPESVGRSLSSIKVKHSLEKKTDGSGFEPVEIVEFKLWSKTDALEKLGRHLKLFKEAGSDEGNPLVVRMVEVVRGASGTSSPDADNPSP